MSFMKRLEPWVLVLGVALVLGPACHGQAVPSTALTATAGPYQTVTGTVFDPSGAPAPGVEMWVTPGGSLLQEVKSGAGGKFTISWQPMNFEPGAMAPAIQSMLWGRDIEHNFAATLQIDEKTTNADLHLQSGLTLSGSLQDTNGVAVKTATLRILMMSPPINSVVDRQATTVNEQGAFTINALPRGRPYSLMVTAPGFGAPSVQITANQTQTASLQLPPIQLKPADQRLEGRVLGPDDLPVPGATVRASGAGQPTDITRTDTNGHFALKVCAGQVRLIAVAPASAAGSANGRLGSGTVQAQAGDLNAVVKLGPRRSGPASAAQPPTAVSPAQPSPRLLIPAQPSVPNPAPPTEPAGGWGAIGSWAQQHTVALVVLVCAQTLVLFGAAGMIVWLLCRKGS